MTGAALPVPGSFGELDASSEGAYRAWRDAKLAAYPQRVEDLVVEVRDPRHLTPAEHAALLDRCRRANMAIYASQLVGLGGKEVLRAVGEQFGLRRLDHNLNADEDAITPLQVADSGPRTGYIPYTSRAIDWHTDGYYNRLDEQVSAVILHCVHPAAEGGENALLDHEVAYIWLRDVSPDLVRALMQPDAMTIPANAGDGEEVRPERTGPVWMVRPDRRLHMRYTRRKRNIVWNSAPNVQAAVTLLAERLASSSSPVLVGRLQPGWGLMCNNVLHTRTGFVDPAPPEPGRLIYRGRFYDRIAGT
jgi:hypothetical protein